MSNYKDPEILKLIPQKYWDVLKDCYFKDGEYFVSLHGGAIFDIGGDAGKYHTDDLTKLLKVLGTISHVRVREYEHGELSARPRTETKHKKKAYEYD